MQTFINSLNIVRETEKAVLVSLLRNNEWMVEDHLDNTVEIWFPKSQVEIEDGKVIAATEWIIKSKMKENEEYTLSFQNSWKGFDEKELATVEAAEKREAALNAGIAKYDDLVARAKAAGLPVRARMKTATILKIAAEHGIVL